MTKVVVETVFGDVEAHVTKGFAKALQEEELYGRVPGVDIFPDEDLLEQIQESPFSDLDDDDW